MAQTYPLSKTMCHTLGPCQKQSTALLFSIHDPSSFRHSGEILKAHRIRVFASSQIRQSHLPRPDVIGRSLASTGANLFASDRWKSAVPRGATTVVHASAVPRILPGAGPLRDFLFALIGAVLSFLIAGVLARVWCLEERYFRTTSAERGAATMPEMGSSQGQKESVEWVNMVIHKVWKVYRRSLEVWLVQLLQPAIDNLGKPNWVKRVKIVELNLDYEPIIVRNVQRRASR
jgi:hypothetical protein